MGSDLGIHTDDREATEEWTRLDQIKKTRVNQVFCLDRYMNEERNVWATRLIHVGNVNASKSHQDSTGVAGRSAEGDAGNGTDAPYMTALMHWIHQAVSHKDQMELIGPTETGQRGLVFSSIYTDHYHQHFVLETNPCKKPRYRIYRVFFEGLRLAEHTLASRCKQRKFRPETLFLDNMREFGLRLQGAWGIEPSQSRVDVANLKTKWYQKRRPPHYRTITHCMIPSSQLTGAQSGFGDGKWCPLVQ
jgi:hypothetical protein